MGRDMSLAGRSLERIPIEQSETGWEQDYLSTITGSQIGLIKITISL